MDRSVTEQHIARIDSEWVPNTLRVSKDLRQAAYVTSAGVGFAVVLNGARQDKVHDGIGDLTFSPDGERFAYRAQAGESQFVVIDDQEGDKFDGTGQGSLCFSPDSRRVAYAAMSGGRWSVVVDGQPQGDYDGLAGLVFSPDSQHVAYRARLGGKGLAVVGGEAGAHYDAVRDLIYSPDGSRMAYRAEEDGRGFMVIGNREGRVYDAIQDGSLVFSPDGRRLAFVARTGRESSVVTDGTQSRPYPTIEGTPVFSPDGRRMAFVARKARFVRLPFLGGPRTVVVDGREWEAAAAIKHVTFSLDSQHLAYAARHGTQWSVLLDGEPSTAGAGYEDLGDLTFAPAGGPEGSRLAYGAKSGGRYFVVVDDSEGTAYDGVVLGAAGGRISFHSSHSLRYLALKGDDLFAIEETLQDADRTQVRAGV